MESAIRTVFGPGAFRMILAIMVFISHVSLWYIGTPSVTVFLMLSGYWVTSIYMNQRYNGVGAYFIGRLFRLWPLVILAASVAWLIQMAVKGSTLGSFWSTVFFLGLASRKNDIVATVWSLDIELQFYAALPLVMAGLAAAGGRWRLALSIGAVVGLGLGILLGRAGVVTALLFAPAFAIGIWLERSQWTPSRRMVIISLVAFVLALAAYAKLMPPDTRKLMTVDVSHFNLGTLLVALTAVPFVAWNVHVKSGRLDRWLGDLSYPFYLLHFPVIYGATKLMGHSLLMKTVALVSTIALSVAVNLLIDRPLERWRRNLLAVRP